MSIIRTSKPTFGFPRKQGLYDPQNEKDSCGVGFIANIKGVRTHEMLDDATEILIRMTHRGACGCDPNTGDGAGFLTALPHEFLAKVAQRDLGVTLPEPGKFGAGIVFLPKNDKSREHCKSVVEQIISEQGQQLLGWREVPTDAKGANVGPTALAAEPVSEMLLIGAGEGLEGDSFERQLYVIRKRASEALRGADFD